MNMIRMSNTKNLREGDVLGRDAYRDHSLVLKKGTTLTNQHIKRLKSFGIETVQIFFTMTPKNDAHLKKRKKMRRNRQKKSSSIA